MRRISDHHKNTHHTPPLTCPCVPAAPVTNTGLRPPSKHVSHQACIKPTTQQPSAELVIAHGFTCCCLCCCCCMLQAVLPHHCCGPLPLLFPGALLPLLLPGALLLGLLPCPLLLGGREMRAANLPFQSSGRAMVMCLSGSSGQKRDVVRRTYPAHANTAAHDADAPPRLPQSQHSRKNITGSVVLLSAADANLDASRYAAPGQHTTPNLAAAAMQDTCCKLHPNFKKRMPPVPAAVSGMPSHIITKSIKASPSPWQTMQVPKWPRLPLVGARAQPDPLHAVQRASYTCIRVCKHNIRQENNSRIPWVVSE